MQAVILAAGRGSRMGALTERTPKPLLVVGGKTLLEHKFDILPPEIDEVILIVGFMGSKIQEYFGGEWKGRRVLYVEQEKLDGTAGALWRAQNILHDRFLVLNADDLYAEDDAKRCAAADDWSMLVHETEHVRSGNVMLGENSAILDIEEGDYDKPGFTNTGMYALDTRIFGFPLVQKSEGSDEFGLPQTMLAAARSARIPLSAVRASFWFQLTAPEDIARAEEMLAVRSLTQ